MQTWVCSCFCCLVYMWSFKAQNLELKIKWTPFELTWNIKDNLKKPDFSEPTVIKAVVYLVKTIIWNFLHQDTHYHILKALGICFSAQFPPYSSLPLQKIMLQFSLAVNDGCFLDWPNQTHHMTLSPCDF